MVRITNGEQIALALQARLKRLGRKDARSKLAQTGKADTVSLNQAPASEQTQFPDDLDDDALKRLLVKRFLEDEFGTDFAKDHRFARMVDRVTEQIGSDEISDALLSEAMSTLKRPDERQP